jgi:hypothetical protein
VETENSPEATPPPQSEQLAINFPLLPLIEPSLWKKLLHAEGMIEQPSLPAASKDEAQTNIKKITAQLKQRHPFSQEKNSITLGGIRYDKSTRQIFIPASVQYPRAGDDRHPGELELILCSTTGRTHETLFVTKTRPLHLEVLLHLVGYQKSSPPSTFRVSVSITNHAPIPIEKLISASHGDTLPEQLTWEFSGSDFGDLYPPDLTGDFLICWHAHDSVMRVQHEKIASGEFKLGIIKHQLLEKNTPVTLVLSQVHRAP